MYGHFALRVSYVVYQPNSNRVVLISGASPDSAALRSEEKV